MMVLFKVEYTGNNRRFKNRVFETYASCNREAVENIYREYLDYNYFPDDETKFGGIVRDCDLDVVANKGDDTMDFDGGVFYAYEVKQKNEH